MNANRRFLYEVIGSGLDLGTMTPEDLLRHVTPEILAHHLPVTLKAKLLEASLAAEKMTPALVVDTVGLEGLAEHAPTAALWGCIQECARRLTGDDSAILSAATGTANGTGTSTAIGGAAASEAGELKPNKSARPTSVRLPGRISALSPRSRSASTVRGSDPATPRVDGGEFDVGDEDERTGDRPASMSDELPPDEQTRPGDITGRKL